MTNRRLLRQVLPELDPGEEFADPAEAFRQLRAALGGERLALLTAGPEDSAHYEHRLLAEELGADLVTLPDLDFSAGECRVRGERVDVLYRRIDEEELTGVPGLLDAVADGALVLANAPGNGVADDKVLYRYVPRLIEYYLDEEPLIDNVHTYLCRDPADREEVLDRLAELVVKPVDGYGGQGVLVGTQAGAQELAEARKRILAEPSRWVAQEIVDLSTHPTFDGRRLRPHNIDLRAFVYMGRETVVPPAALTRVAPADSMIVNSSQGGGAKDTWIPRGV